LEPCFSASLKECVYYLCSIGIGVIENDSSSFFSGEGNESNLIDCANGEELFEPLLILELNLSMD
jgi:hypothetical protein